MFLSYTMSSEREQFAVLTVDSDADRDGVVTMADERVALDTDEATTVSARWRAYADRVEQHGAADPAAPEALRQALGEMYADFIDAKVVEQRERAAAYQRVSAQARKHADKLDTTVALFESADTDNSVRLNRLAVD
jgi:hypothetical protein